MVKKFATEISNDELAAMPAAHFDGDIRVVEDDAGMREAYDYLSQHKILGFDTETRPSFTPRHINRMSLVQLSTYERCYLIRLCKTGKLSGEIVSLLQNRNILKVGVAVTGDIQGLNKVQKVKADGFVELQTEVKKFGIENFSLRKMAGITLGERVSKAQRLSNWEAAALTEQQQMYAATDAWVCLKIYDALQSANTDSM